ncbi:MAG: DUF4299 family protein [Erysipelotrichaceae bacterium]|nr:DUF4299 family protein [Erysipelotrichaceae bacterium]
MAVNVEIKLNGKKIEINEIAALKDLCYGVSDNNYTLEEGQIGSYTILFDPNCISRGIEASIESNVLLLRMSLPTTESEIHLFYDLIFSICKHIHVNEFVRDDEIISLKHSHDFIESDKQTSIRALQDIENKVRNKESEQFYIFGALNPISLGQKEFDEMNGSYDNFERMLNQKQQLDVFYANPKLYQRNDQTIFGIYFVGENIDTVVPEKAHVPFNNIEVDSWYVMIPDNNAIPYKDFIKNVTIIDQYDHDHVIVRLSQQEIIYLAMNCAEDYTTKEKVKGTYLGKTYDNGFDHLQKIRELKLPIEEYAAFNHMAVYLRWCNEHNLLSDYLLQEVPGIKETKDYRKLLVDNKYFNGKIRSQHLNDIGQDFSDSFYKFDGQGYPSYVDQYALETLGEEKYYCKEYQNEAYLFVEYNEEYYQGLSKYIDEAYEKYREK